MVAASQPFDDRDGWIWLDGKLVPWRDAKIHVLTHALHYGSAVFEGERIYGGKVFKLREHSQRLIDSGKILGFDVPMTAEEIDRATNETVAANKMVNGYVRPIAWRGAEQMGVAAQQAKIHVAIAVWEWPAYFGPEAKMKGLKLTMAKYRRPDPATSPCLAKATGLYMICTLEKHAAEAAGYADALMLDWRGQIAETTGANVFFIIDGEIHTPKPDCFLDGITRRAVIELAKKRQYKVIERAILPQEMAKATEAFLTGTAAELTPIASIGDYKFTPGTISKNLMEDFDKLTRGAA
jgi:branched-chain amino acid aminotransferase